MKALDKDDDILVEGVTVEFNYRGEKQTGTVVSIAGKRSPLVKVKVDEEFWTRNDGVIIAGYKQNTFSPSALKIIKSGDNMSTKEELYIEGDRVVVRTKAELIEDLGADAAGYPKSTARFNTSGRMDHYFGLTGVVTKCVEAVTSEGTGQYVTIDFDNKNPKIAAEGGYSWVVSSDMLEKEGAVPKVPTLPAVKLRTFLPSVKGEPTLKQVWRALMELKKKLNLPDGTVVHYMAVLKSTGDYAGLKELMETSKVEEFNAASIDLIMDSVQPYYPAVDIEVLSFALRVLAQPKPDPKTYKLLEYIVSLKANSRIAMEMSAVPFTPIKRLLKTIISESEFNKIFNYLSIKDSYADEVSSLSMNYLLQDITSKVTSYLNEKNKYQLEAGDIIEIGE